MIEYAIDFCRQNAIPFLRLDCDATREKLCLLYEKSGFKKVDTKHFSTNKYGELKVSLFQIEINKEIIFSLKWDGEEF